jgi:hypothetical protein
MSKDINHFWRVWSSKVCNKIVNTSCIDGEVDDHKIADAFCKKFSEPMVNVSSLESYCDKLHIDDTTQACVLSVETVDDVISRIMKRCKAASHTGIRYLQPS